MSYCLGCARFQEEIASLKNAINEYREGRNSALEGWNKKAIEYQLNNARLEKSLQAMREALKRYGNHEAGCKEINKDEPCQCGLSKLLEDSNDGK